MTIWRMHCQSKNRAGFRERERPRPRDRDRETESDRQTNTDRSADLVE